MPRYHFDTECGGSRYQDPDGIELQSIDQARQQLAALLRDLTFTIHPEDMAIVVKAKVLCDSAVVLQGSCILTIDGRQGRTPVLRERPRTA